MATAGGALRARPQRDADDRRRQALELLVACLLALFAGYVLAKRGPTVAFALVCVPLVLYVLLSRAFWMFGVALVVGLIFPYTENIGFSQAASFRVAAAGAVAAIGIVVLRSDVRIRPTFVDVAVAGFLGLTVVSWLTYHTSGSATTTLNPLLPFAFYFAARLVRRASLWNVLWIVTAAGAAGALTVLYEYFVTQSPLFLEKATYLYNESSTTIYRPGGVFESPPAASVALSIAALCALPLIERHRGGRRAAAAACASISVVALFLTFTRVGLIGFAAGLLLFGLLGGSQIVTPRRTAIAAVFVAAAIAALFLPTVQHTRWYQQGIVRRGNFSARVSYWTLAKPLITDSTGHLLLGRGANALPTEGQPVTTNRVGAGLAGTPVLTKVGPHSQYVRILLEQGLVGLVLLVLWLLGAPLYAIGHLRRAGPVRPIVAALVGSTASFIALSFVDDSLRQPQTVVAGAVVTGLLVAAARSPARAGAEGEKA